VTDPRRPIGPLELPDPIRASDVARWIDEIEELPSNLRLLASQLEDDQLDVRYREGGWTVRQIVHHMADSHLNAFIRVKWALTEENPVIKDYDDRMWAELPDSTGACIGLSLDMLDTLHARWIELLVALTPTDLASPFQHPESGPTRIDATIGLYAWHGRHHLAQISALAHRQGWMAGAS